MNRSHRFLQSSKTNHQWKSLLQHAAATYCTKNHNILHGPPHFQSFCFYPPPPKDNADLQRSKVLEGFDLSSLMHRPIPPDWITTMMMIPSKSKNKKHKRRDSGVLVLIEPVEYVLKPKIDGEFNASSTAVLPLFAHELRTFVTRRSANMTAHKGEICFPGGKCDENETVEEAAIREGIEEIGADPSKYEIVGRLSQVYSPPSKALVTPILAIANGTSVVELDEEELKLRNERLLKKLAEETERTRLRGDTSRPPPPQVAETSTKPSSVSQSISSSSSSLGLSICSPNEVDSIQSINLLELLVSTDKHHVIDRKWRGLNNTEVANQMQIMFPAFYTFEDQELLWGLTSCIFTELLTILSQELVHMDDVELQNEELGSAIFTKELMKSFLKRSPKEFLDRFDGGGEEIMAKRDCGKRRVRKLMNVGREFLPIWYPKYCRW